MPHGACETESKTGSKAMKFGPWEQMTGHLALSREDCSARICKWKCRQQGKTKDEDNVLARDQRISPHRKEVQE